MNALACPVEKYIGLRKKRKLRYNMHNARKF